MSSYKAVIIDLDGTLLNDQKRVGEKDFKTLMGLGDENICRIIATGRSLYSFNEVIKKDFPIDYLIFAAGGGTYDFNKKELLRADFIPSGDVEKIAHKLDKLKVDYQIRLKIPDSHKYLYKQFSEYNPDFERLNNIYAKYIEKITDTFNGHIDATRFIVIAQNDEIVEIIKKEFREYSVIRATSPIDHKSVWMEIYPKHINKGYAVSKLCSDINIDISETVGIGNDYNDIEFLDIVGEKYIVSNAPLGLRNKYKAIVSNNENPLNHIVSLSR